MGRLKKYSGNALRWAGQQKGCIVPTSASCLLGDFGGNNVVSPPRFSNLWKYLDDSTSKLKNKRPVYKTGLLQTFVRCIQKRAVFFSHSSYMSEAQGCLSILVMLHH